MSSKRRFLELLASFVTTWLPHTKGLSKNTVRSYQQAFSLLFTYLHDEHGVKPMCVGFDTLTKDTLCGWLDWLEVRRGCKPQTRNQRLAALSSFADYAADEDMESALVFCSAVAAIPAKRTHKGGSVVHFTLEEVRLLLALPDTSGRIGSRDAVMLSVLYSSGARAQELCDLRVGDIHFGKQTVLKIIGKGNKARQVAIHRQCADLLRRYLKRIGLGDGGTDVLSRHLFSSQTHEHMTISCVEEVVAKYVTRAKKLYPDRFPHESYTPHSFRHSIAVHMLEAEIPLPVIKVFLGHASIETTMIYATVTPELAAKYLKEKSPDIGIKLTAWKKPIADALPFLLKYAD
ncbi:MAG: site-specific integrase [Coriobacteriales bacterium]|jgi:site-specific recombinase XerD|nr:site-specific integrase [Coriobacteriales bacterium]